MTRTLQAPVTVAFDYTRSTGPVLGRFFTGLRDGVLVGGRTSSGQVLVPPAEFDPDTHQPTTDFVEVAAAGTVTAWSWCPEPVAGQPLDRPFAWVQVRLDGADGTLLHALDVASPEDVETGMRVQARWAEERSGVITDIACFEPEGGGADQGSGVSTTLASLAAQPPEGLAAQPPEGLAAQPPEGLTQPPEGLTQPPEGLTAQPPEEGVTAPPPEVTGIITPVELDYLYAASPEESAFYRGLEEGRIVGQRCPACHKVYVPPRSACPVDGVATTDEVELGHTGTVTTFCIVNVPFMGQKITPPYVSAYVLLDGADIAFLHLILDIPAEEVRMGMRVKAVWKPREEWGTTIENISHFAPTGEPDADYETYKQHL